MELYQIRVEGDLERLSGIWPRTDAAASCRNYVFQCADVLEVWCDTIGKAQGVTPLFVAVLDAQGAPLLLLPLGLKRSMGVRQLVLLDETVCDYNAPVVFAGARDWDAATMSRVWTDIVARLPAFDVAVLERMPEFVEDWPNPMRFLATGTSSAGSHAVTLPADWDRDGRSVLPNWRDSRRRERKLAERGELTIAVAQDLEQAVAFLDGMIAMKREKLRDLTGIDPFQAKAGYRDYYREATRRLFSTGAVHLSAVKLDGQILAAHWGYALRGRFYQLMPAFRENDEWRFYAPGRLLNEHLMAWSAHRGFSVFDFGFGDEPYKMDYCDTHWRLSDAVLPVTSAGRLWALARRTRRLAADVLRDTDLGRLIKAARSRLRRALPRRARDETAGKAGLRWGPRVACEQTRRIG
jgi:CelD/BcsL family acetyltransferase involved in cellulose biosynthesis